MLIFLTMALETPRLRKPRWFELLSLAGGLGLFFMLVRETGFGLIVRTVWHVGAGFLLLILISGVRHLLRTLAWRLSIEPSERRVSFLELFGFRLAGEAVTDLTFLGPVLGETVKAVAASRRMSVAQSASSLLIENLLYGAAMLLLIFGGLLVFFIEFAPSRDVKIAGAVGCAVLALPVLGVGFLIVKRIRLLGAVLEWLKARNVRRKFLEKVEGKVARFEDCVHGFYERHKWRFAVILAVEIVAALTGILETYIILSIIASHASFFAAWVAEAAVRVVNTVFAFVPMRVGVEEGGAALALGAAGYAAGTGVALGVIRKIRTFFWVAWGLLMLARASWAKGETDSKATPAGVAKVLR